MLPRLNNKPLIINNILIPQEFKKILPYNSNLKYLAREKRKAGILSEVIFWQHVHKKKFYNLDFDRQVVIGNYIVDFCVKSLGLVIEIDGSSHEDKIEYDRNRTQYLRDLGLKIFVVGDLEVKLRMDLILRDLEEFILKEFGGKG